MADALDDEGLERREVIGRLWFARDLALGARWVCVVIAVGAFATAAIGPDLGFGAHWLPVAGGVFVGALALLGVAFARRRPELVAASAWSAPAVLVGGGAGAASSGWLAVLTVFAGLAGAWSTFRAIRSRMLGARRLAEEHPGLQAARAWRGESFVRDPYQP